MKPIVLIETLTVLKNMKSIKRVYLGLPFNFKDILLWVLDTYRTNPLSLVPGGSDVVVEYHTEGILGYDKIKYPSRYIRKFWNETILKGNTNFADLNSQDVLSIFKSKINRVYARKYGQDSYDTVPFTEVWNCIDSKVLPWEALLPFDAVIPNSGMSDADLENYINHIIDSEMTDADLENYINHITDSEMTDSEFDLYLKTLGA